MRILFIFTAIVLFASCKKESFITGPEAQIIITADTVRFDTVFTTTGSVTQTFRIINDNDRRLKISAISLAGGATSSFRLNADGVPGPEVSDIEIAANDSIHLFVTVTIDPNAASLPFVVRDSIEIVFNGNRELVQLEAWGQNAHFIRDGEITVDETWNNDLPYVILGGLYVHENVTLIINSGCRIYMHANAPLIVDGSLITNGAVDTADHIVFTGDRLDEPYNDFPASWPGIYFRNPSHSNILRYTEIRNAYQAIIVEDPSPNLQPKLALKECIIDNAYDIGLAGINSSIEAENCLITNCGRNLLLAGGGDYLFTHCTVTAYSNSYMLHSDPVLQVSNFVLVNNLPVTAPLNANFINSIFWGDFGTTEEEVVAARSGTDAFNVHFDHCLIKAEDLLADVQLTQCIFNQNPQFRNIETGEGYYDFRLQQSSPAVESARLSGIATDLDGFTRPSGGQPDMGCFEYH